MVIADVKRGDDGIVAAYFEYLDSLVQIIIIEIIPFHYLVAIGK